MRLLLYIVVLGVVTTIFPSEIAAQDLTIALGSESSLSGRTIQLFALITVLSLAPGLAIMITCFPFIVTVLSILRQAIGLQSSPPNMLIVSLALFLTYFVMEPVFTTAWQQGLEPLTNQQIDVETAFVRTIEPFREFMALRLDPETYSDMAALRPDMQDVELSSESPYPFWCQAFYCRKYQGRFKLGF